MNHYPNFALMGFDPELGSRERKNQVLRREVYNYYMNNFGERGTHLWDGHT